MDFSLGEKAQAVREKIQLFLSENYTAEDRARAEAANDGHDWIAYRKLAAQGWVSAAWPTEYGGGGMDAYEMLALHWELARAKFPWYGLLYNSFIGHTLLACGSAQQRSELVPRIADGEVLVALGYSEPGSGSDVAAARTTAVREGDQWRVNGQKMFITMAHCAQYIFTITRTDPSVSRHRGLTMLMIPTDSPGIEIQPIETLGGERTNAVFMDDVLVDDALRVGDVDGGWSVLLFALQLEQAIGYADLQQGLLEKALDYTQSHGLGEDPTTGRQVARMAINAEVARLLRYRSTWVTAEGLDRPAAGPMTKSFSADSYLQDSRDWLQLLGPKAVLEEASYEESAFAAVFRGAPVTTIYGGTVEILRSMIAQQGLGLPRNR
jgi:alkylation response protein AidB-like acyl-CoA dehydrogenase